MKVALIMVAVTALIAGPLLFIGAHLENDFIARCESAGGVAKIGRSIHLCLKPDALIKVD